MIRSEVKTPVATIKYFLTYKKVKNINLRVSADGTVHVSANNRVPVEVIEEFILSKADFILKALEKYKNRYVAPLKQYFTEREVKEVILDICERVYPYYEKKGINYPQIKFRKMVSQWGNCRSSEGVLAFNLNLMYAPIECIKYVVLHEFTHFLQPNHSRLFYDELEKVCPDWKLCRKILKEINLR